MSVPCRPRWNPGRPSRVSFWKKIKHGHVPGARGALSERLLDPLSEVVGHLGLLPFLLEEALGQLLDLPVQFPNLDAVPVGLGESMARLVRGPEWAPMGTNSVEEQFVDEAASDAVLQEVAT
jgi:hypothetical protein